MVKDIVDRAFARAIAILEGNRHLLDSSAISLLQHETLSGQDLEQIAAQVQRDEPNPLLQASGVDIPPTGSGFEHTLLKAL